MSAPVRSPHRRRRLAALVTGLLLVGGASACGVKQGTDVVAGPGGPGGAVATTSTVVLEEGSFEGTGGAVFLRQAAAATSDVTTQRMSMTITTTGMPVFGEMEMTYEGAFDNESGLGHMTVDMGDLLAALGAGSGQMEMVIDGDVVYLRSDLFESLAGGKPWVRLADDELGAGSDAGLGFQGDPTSFLDFLEGVGDELETVGREDLRGVPTTHLRTEIDMAKLMEEASEADRQEYQMSIEGLGAADAFDAVPVEAWVDDNGYVRRFLLTFVMAGLLDDQPGVGGDITMVLDVELYDFNAPVEVVVPDPSDVADLSSFGGFGN